MILTSCGSALIAASIHQRIISADGWGNSGTRSTAQGKLGRGWIRAVRPVELDGVRQMHGNRNTPLFAVVALPCKLQVRNAVTWGTPWFIRVPAWRSAPAEPAWLHRFQIKIRIVHTSK